MPRKSKSKKKKTSSDKKTLTDWISGKWIENIRKIRPPKKAKKLKLPKNVHVVQELSAQELHKKIHELTRKLTKDILTKGEVNFEIPTRSAGNVIYDEVNDLLLLGNKTFTRPLLSLRSARESAMTMRVLELIHYLIEENIHATKREVYYNDPALFKEQSNSDSIIEDIAALMATPRDSLHVVAAAKGAVIGRLKFKEGGDEIDCTKQGTGGKSITPFIDTITDIESDAEFILIVEKDAAFLRLAEDRFYNRYPSIIVTGKGQPDIATRMFVKKLQRELRLPVLGFVDSDPYGMKILLVYSIGSKRLSYETMFLATPDIKWLGVLPSDLDKYNIPKSARLKMTPADIKTGKLLLKEPFIARRKKWARELSLMVQTKTKAEIQALASHGFRFLTQEYLPQKLETADWI
ncbi:MAG: DNA topoisomerase IV subunit A [Candidatus Asgardarchaeia archaeon]